MLVTSEMNEKYKRSRGDAGCNESPILYRVYGVDTMHNGSLESHLHAMVITAIDSHNAIPALVLSH